MIFCFVLLKSGKITSKNRKWLYAAAFALFGIILGADPPSPMGGTVKDAAYLYGKAGAIFPPRMIALTIFLATVLLANKFICSWGGCQFGTLQDFVFRLNSDAEKKDYPHSSHRSLCPTLYALLFLLLCFIRR